MRNALDDLSKTPYTTHSFEKALGVTLRAARNFQKVSKKGTFEVQGVICQITSTGKPETLTDHRALITAGKSKFIAEKYRFEENKFYYKNSKTDDVISKHYIEYLIDNERLNNPFYLRGKGLRNIFYLPKLVINQDFAKRFSNDNLKQYFLILLAFITVILTHWIDIKSFGDDPLHFGVVFGTLCKYFLPVAVAVSFIFIFMLEDKEDNDTEYHVPNILSQYYLYGKKPREKDQKKLKRVNLEISIGIAVAGVASPYLGIFNLITVFGLLVCLRNWYRVQAYEDAQILAQEILRDSKIEMEIVSDSSPVHPLVKELQTMAESAKSKDVYGYAEYRIINAYEKDLPEGERLIAQLPADLQAQETEKHLKLLTSIASEYQETGTSRTDLETHYLYLKTLKKEISDRK